MVFFFFKQKTAYEMRISDWSSDVCSSDLPARHLRAWREQRRTGGVGNRGAGTVPGDRRSEHDHPAADQGRIDPRIAQIRSAARADLRQSRPERKSVVAGKSVSVRVDLGCNRIVK